MVGLTSDGKPGLCQQAFVILAPITPEVTLLLAELNRTLLFWHIALLLPVIDGEAIGNFILGHSVKTEEELHDSNVFVAVTVYSKQVGMFSGGHPTLISGKLMVLPVADGKISVPTQRNETLDELAVAVI